MVLHQEGKRENGGKILKHKGFGRFGYENREKSFAQKYSKTEQLLHKIDEKMKLFKLFLIRL